ncbi:MAG TPA: TatD family hydrolase, partial [Gemmatimonadales bacterium]
ATARARAAAPRPAARTLVDSHCHLGDAAFDADRDAVLARARAAGVSHVVVIGESLAGSERALALARATGGLSATAGVHPHEAKDWTAAARGRLSELLARPEVVAVGETGLDYHYMHSPRAEQRAAFEAHLELAAELGKPVIVHARDADDDLAAILRNLGPRAPVVVLHSFSSGDAVWEAGMAISAYFSFSGMITFKNWRQTARVAECPADRLLVETDAPYLAPVPHRGERNEPAFVRDVAARAAELRGESLDTLAQRSAANARLCLGLRLDSTL